MLISDGLTLWPGGSLVSGNLADDGGGSAGTDATGTVTEWAPACPYSISDVAAETTWIECGNCDAVRIRPIITGTLTSFDSMVLTLFVACFDLIEGEQAYYLPRLINPSWTTGAVASMKTLASGSDFPTGKLANGAGSISSYYQPLVFPSTDIGFGDTVGTVAFDRDFAYTAGASPLAGGAMTLPTGGAKGMAYRIGACNIAGTSAAVTGVGIRLIYEKLAIAYGSRGEVAKAG